MPLQATSGAASYDAFGGGAAAVPQYIEDVFSTYLYTGTGATATITNNIDLSTKGGLVWFKARNIVSNHGLYDTARGATNSLISNSTNGQSSIPNGLTVFNTNGFTIGNNATVNGSGNTFTSWTFRKQPKFFDVVTYTGDGTNNRAISHNLGSTPGCIFVKETNGVRNWFVYHRSNGNGKYILLNTTAATVTNADAFPSVTSTTFTPVNVAASLAMNVNGGTYVAYIFAHDAGGFGLTGTDNVISCGSYTGNGSSQTITLGYEPQWLMIKRVDDVSPWRMHDVMRGMSITANLYLEANTSSAEASYLIVNPTATGFTLQSGPPYYNASGGTYIYIAIRRDPMKVPTSGTSVFSPNIANTVDGTPVTTGFPVDLQLLKPRPDVYGTNAVSRLTGVSTVSSGTETYLKTSATDAEVTGSTGQTKMWGNTGFEIPSAWGYTSMIWWNFRRAPSFMDVVCYTGNDTAGRTVTHNLGAVPELMIFKSRNNASNWPTYHSALGNSSGVFLNLTNASASNSDWNNTTPTASVFTLGSGARTNASGWTYVAYLFATCAGVSKVGSYTGTATTKQIDCGFTAGARFVLIKKTSGTGSWYVWDSARGIVSGNDPYLLLNSTAAEVTNTDYVDTYSAGFEISSTAPSEINENGGSFIFLAIS